MQASWSSHCHGNGESSVTYHVKYKIEAIPVYLGAFTVPDDCELISCNAVERIDNANYPHLIVVTRKIKQDDGPYR